MKTPKIIGLVLLLVLLALPATAQETAARTPQEICDAATPAQTPASRQFTQPEQVLEAGVDYSAVFCTGVGAVYVDLFEEYAPITVNNFVFLAQQGYYNNTTFHRVIQDFMAQAGDPEGTGMGGPGYQFEDEFVGFLSFDRPGLLAMANAGPGTNGSQFFITTALTDWLNYKHTIFGEVLAGMDIVKAIQLRDPATATAPGTTLETVVIITDPATVNIPLEEIPVATAEDFQNALAPLSDPLNIPADIQVIAELTGVFTSEQVVAAAKPDIAETYADYLAKYHHQYRVSLAVRNVTCSQEYFFTSLAYTVDAYGSADEAAASLADKTLDDINASAGYTRAESRYVFYTQPITDCSGGQTLIGRVYLQRGRYVVNIEGILPQAILQSVALDNVLAINAAGIFERLLGSQFRSELRHGS